MFPIRCTHTPYSALFLLSCVGQGAGLPAAGLRACVRVAATTTITHLRPLWDNSLLRMSVCASLRGSGLTTGVRLQPVEGSPLRAEVGLRTHVECGLPKVSRVLGLCVACPEPRSAGHQGTTSRQRPSSLAQPCGLAAFAKKPPPPRTHAGRHTLSTHLCAHIMCHLHASLHVHTCERKRAYIRTCPGTHARVRTQGRMSTHGDARELTRTYE